MDYKNECCPDCGSIMIEDAAEVIKLLPNGNVIIDCVYPAWVCSNHCGYFEKVE
jgi:ribosomal protein S27AE